VLDRQAQRLDMAAQRLGRPSEQLARNQLQLSRQAQRLRHAMLLKLRHLQRPASDTGQFAGIFQRSLEQQSTLDRIDLRLQLLDPRWCCSAAADGRAGQARDPGQAG
jgi:exodeoxyribonuclease VII large subunit